MRWSDERLDDMFATVRTHDEELTDQKIELTIHGAAIKQLLEDRTRGREHAWQIKLLIATVLATDLVQILINILPPTHR